MPVGVILDFANGGSEQYDRILERMDLGGKLPAGALFHAAGPYEGGWRVVDVWESPEPFQAFAQSQIGPLSQAEGLPEPRAQMFDVDELLDERGGGERVSHVQVVRLGGVDRDAFVAADSQIRDEGAAPAGCLFHVNGPTDDGWLVADAWTSRDVRDAFIAEKVAPAMGAAGMAPPRIEDLPVHNTLAPR